MTLAAGPNVRAMKKEHQAFSGRLCAALSDAGIEASPAELEKLLARHGGEPVTPQAISGWLNGRHMPKQANMRALALMLGMEPYVLQFGKEAKSSVGEVRSAWPAAASAHDRLAITLLLTLPAPQRKLVRELIHALADTQHEDGPN